MNLEKSPFHITNNKVLETNKLLKKNITNQQPISKTEDSSSFWNWFRGLVNPLQNLPIISGIYSSMNSDDSNSDRDLIQNSLGGFMYGGPIGAIAGFGNWIFNKLFDKTPTELALDFTGISNIWKDDQNSKDKVKVVNDDANSKLINSKSLANNSGEWWKKSQFASIENNATSFEFNKTKTKTTDSLRLTESKISLLKEDDNTLAKLSDRYKSHDSLKSKLSDTFNHKVTVDDSLKNIKEEIILDSIKNKDISQNKKINLKQKKTFREINFDYPIWKPDSLEISKNKNLENKNFINQKYLEIKKESNVSKINIKL